MLVSLLGTTSSVSARTSYCCSPRTNTVLQHEIRAEKAAKARKSALAALNFGYLRSQGLPVLASLSAYTAGDPSQGTGSGTADGHRAVFGVAAADPRVFPFGTRLYVPGFGSFVVHDTGGAIRGRRIDLCMGRGHRALNLAYLFGRRDMIIYRSR